MQASEIRIPRKITNQLLHFAQLSPNTEICGLIGGIDGTPCHCYPVDNCAEHPNDRFQLDPKQQIDAMARMRERGEHLFAIYHSHPSAPAAPSAVDLALAAYPEALNLIISLNTKGVLEMRGYKIADRRAEEIPLTLS
ncbi:MAG: Mov34/MPN/PAD-1 family protein [Gammaproteobacteria bacterium]